MINKLTEKKCRVLDNVIYQAQNGRLGVCTDCFSKHLGYSILIAGEYSAEMHVLLVAANQNVCHQLETRMETFYDTITIKPGSVATIQRTTIAKDNFFETSKSLMLI